MSVREYMNPPTHRYKALHRLMSPAKSGVFVLILVVAISTCMQGCTKANPVLTELANSVSGLSFDGQTSKDVTITQLTPPIELAGTCDARVSKWQFTLDGSTWNDLSNSVSSSTSNNGSTLCQNQRFSFSMPTHLFGFSLGNSGSKTMRIRGVMEFGTTVESYVHVIYSPSPSLASGRIIPGQATQTGTSGGQSVIFRAAISGPSNEAFLKDSNGRTVLHVTRGN
jgi:hypothetical protein